MTSQKITYLFLCVILLTGCRNEDGFIGKQLFIDTGTFEVAQNPRSVEKGDVSQMNKFSMVTYFGQGCCNVCSMKMMTVWDALADDLGRNDVCYYFIFSNSDGISIETCNQILSQYYFSFPVYLDCYDSFLINNPYVEQFETPICILLDADGQILDYGRPDIEKKDFRRFFKIIKKDMK